MDRRSFLRCLTIGGTVLAVNPLAVAEVLSSKKFGEKTLSAGTSSLNRINVRTLLLYIEKTMVEYLDAWKYQFNDATLRSEVKSGAEGFMDVLKSKRTIYSYQIVCDETNNSPKSIDNNELNMTVNLITIVKEEINMSFTYGGRVNERT